VTTALDTLVDGLAFPECPRWRDGELWLSEKRGGRVLAVTEGGARRTVADVPGGPGGIGWTPDGDLLVLDMTARALLVLRAGGLATVADLTELTAGRCNDMIVDRVGRAYVGHFGYDLLGGAPAAPATLVMVRPDGSAITVAEDLHFPNGCALTPDGSTLLVAESAAGRVTAFDVEPDGSLSGRRVFAALDGVVPDGIALDAAGALWVSDPVGGALVRVEPGGVVTSRVSTAPAGAFACALGGHDGRTLFACLYTEQASQLADGAPPIGSVVTMRVDVPAAGSG
jgi:sugar lactone lactonase YvrE